MHLKVPLFYYPTTIGLLDDDQAFAIKLERRISQILGASPVKAFQDPEQALSFIKQSKPLNPLLKRHIKALEEEAAENYGSVFEVRTLFETLYDDTRFQELSVLLVDYDMPGMNGLEFLEQVDTPVQKILLTGVGDETLAVEAFNKGLIDGYLKKHDANLFDQLFPVLKTAFERYFLTLSRSFESHLGSEDLNHLPLTQSAFQKYFESLLKTHRIEEYYLLQKTGTYLMRTEKGILKGLYVYGEDFIEALLESQEAESADPDVLEEIKTGRQVLCTYTPYQTQVPPGYLWRPYLRPADTLRTATHTFYAAPSDLLFEMKREAPS